MNKKWIDFNSTTYPKERKDVLVKIQQFSTTLPQAIVVGYLRYGGGDKDCPYFVCPGVGGEWVVLAWCDCLPKGLFSVS